MTDPAPEIPVPLTTTHTVGAGSHTAFHNKINWLLNGLETDASPTTTEATMANVDANAASNFRVQQDARIRSITPAFGAVVTIGDSAAQIQTKADACAAAGTTLGIPAGTWTIASTVTFQCSVHADRNAIFTGNASPLVKVGNGTTVLSWALLRLPKISRQTKNWGASGTLGLGVIGTDVGLRIDDTRTCEFHIPRVDNFSVGVDIADDNGSLYNKIFLGHLDNNAVNMRFATSGAGGAANECQIIGGRYSHNSGEGSNVAGTRHIALLAGSTVGPNNLIFLGGSIEGNTAEYHVECQGSYNQFIGLRWEAAAAKALFSSAGAFNNTIVGGYGADEVAVSAVSSGQVATVEGYLKPYRGLVGGADGGFVIQPGSSNGHPAIIILDMSGNVHGTGATAPGTRYNIKMTPQQIIGKFAPGDAHPGLDLRFLNGKVGFGDGATAIGQFIRQETSTMLGFESTGICNPTDNTFDIGQTASRRFRNLYLGGISATGSGATGSRPTVTVVGSQWYDTTLGKPIWWNGSVWKDAAGTTV